MYFKQTLPENLAGDWIWLSPRERLDSCRVFARKEFMLEEIPESVSLRICALPFYHVYINGEHVGYGPAAPTRSNCYVDVYDVTEFLVPGVNTLAVISMDQTAPTWYSHPYKPKFFCQLMADEKTLVATGKDWRIIQAYCYIPNQARCHYGREKVEKVRLNTDLSQWMFNDYDDSSWEEPYVAAPFPEGQPHPVLSGVKPSYWTESVPFEIVQSGTYTDPCAAAYYSYSSFEKITQGNYAAESYAFSMVEGEVEVLISSDEPFIVFCNDDPVISGSRNRTLDRYELPSSPSVGRELLQHCTIPLKKGWNRFLCFQEITPGSMGMMFLFPTVKKGQLTFRREDNNMALPGWNLCGPLRIPLSFSSPSLSPGDMEEEPHGFLPLEEHINDISAFLGNCTFTKDPRVNTGAIVQGAYAVYDLGKFLYGFPVLTLEGSAGDIVDITCGLRLEGNAVKTIGQLGRMTDTVILGEGSNNWMRLVPRGTRYVMISVRKALSGVTPTLRFITAEADLENALSFQCSDEKLNKVWERAMASLTQCWSQNIVDDPCSRRCQALPEAYIYARTLYHISGTENVVEKAIREFADGQLENGMILRIAPSGVYSYSPDTALLWILFLEDHLIHTADPEFLREMEPCLDLLLKFFRMIPPSGDVLLPSERAGHCTFLNPKYELEEQGIFTPLNALYYKALQSAARLYSTIGKDRKSAGCLSLSAQLKEQLDNYTFNGLTGLYADNYNGVRSGSCSLRTNLMALNSGIVTHVRDQKNLINICCHDLEGMLKDCSSAFFFVILDTLFSYGKRKAALKLIYQGSELNLDRIRIYEEGGNPHVFNVICADFLIREFLGVRPSVPGYSQVYFNPACDILQFAKCKLPAGHNGKFQVAWETNGNDLAVNIESNFQLDVLPLIPPSFGATFDLGNYVNLLDAGSGETQ